MTTTVTAKPATPPKKPAKTSERSGRGEQAGHASWWHPPSSSCSSSRRTRCCRRCTCRCSGTASPTPDEKDFVGLSNYTTALTDSLFWNDLWNTVVIMVVSVAVELVIGFAFAMVMHKIIFGRGVIRTSILIPYGIITVVSAFAWQFAFSLNNGFVNGWFSWLPGIGADTNWFGDHWTAMFAIIVSEIWKTTPFMSLLLLAGLSQVSEDMLEAAKVDGATWWQRLWKVILPNMRAAIMVAVLFRALDAFRIFDNIYVMTKGAEGTESSSFLTYRQVIEQFQLGMGSALSVLLFLSVLILAFGIVKLFKVDLAQARGEG